jgi:ABC-type branched-subunit amino acid transport system substrate-binding protein
MNYITTPFLIILLLSSCVSRSPQIRFDPSRKREVLNPERPSSPVKAPSRKEISDLIEVKKIEVPADAIKPSKPVLVSVPPATQAQPQSEVEKPWGEELSRILKSSLPDDEKVDQGAALIDKTFNQKGLGIEAMANEIKMQSPESLVIFDYWLLGKLWDQQKYDEASRFASQLMNSSFEKVKVKAQYLFDQYYLTRKASPQKIGVLIPSNSKQSMRLQNALKLAFGQVEGSKSSYQLIFVDEPDESDSYEKAFSALVNSENVIAIIGGLKSKNRNEVSRLSQKYRIPFIYMGQKSRVTDESQYIFQYGLTNESQARAIAFHAQAQGIKKMAVIYPNDGFGVEAANLFWDEWSALGGQITAAYTYHPQENDFQEIAAKLSNKFNLVARNEEFKKLQKEKIEKDPQSKKRILSQGPAELLPAEYEFEAVYIPDVSRSMAKITASMAYYGIRRLPVYGTRLWANAEAYKLAGSMWSSYLIIPESLYNQADSLGVKHPFLTDYQKYTGSKAEHLEISAFEVSLLLKGVLGVQGIDTREGLREALVQTASVTGVLHQPLYFDEFREIEGPIIPMRFNHLGQLIPAVSEMP